MNLDLLTKLVKLANNNPNENEANLAARKVCKLIAEANFKFNGTTPTPQPTVRAASNPSDVVHDWVKKQYTRPPPDDPREKAPWTYQPSAEQKAYYEQWLKDFARDFRGFKGVSYDAESTFAGVKQPRPPREKRPLKCSRCGVENETAFVGPPQVYVCNTCHWEEYQKGRSGSVY